MSFASFERDIKRRAKMKQLPDLAILILGYGTVIGIIIAWSLGA